MANLFRDEMKNRREPEVLDFDAIRLRIASPEIIMAWSKGEVTKPETINYRTQKPEKDGLFCEKIFGPTKDWECYCGKYKKIRYKGIVCDKCGVEVTSSLVRRERMGHIKLLSPVSHIWFLRGMPSKIGVVLDMSVQNLERVIYCADFIVTSVDEETKAGLLIKLKDEFKSKRKQIINEYERGLSALPEVSPDREKLAMEKEKKFQALQSDFNSTENELKELKPLRVISEHTYHEMSIKYGHIFEAGIGAEAIRELLQRVNIKKTIEMLAVEIAKLESESPLAQANRHERLVRRVKILRSLEKNGIKPEWMVMTVLPVIPPDLRPMVALDGGRFATSDLNDLYRRVINRNNRLRRLVELKAPEVISRNEKRMLQEAVDALIDNSARRTKTVTASTGQKRSLRSLADVLKGKQGRFRQNLLGKRTDYSGRSVIVIGPNLKLHQCGLPKRMALELFKPFIMSRLIKSGAVHNVRSAARVIESDSPEVWDILEDITKETMVLLNRAPTLHRLSIQAFQPILIEGKAIQVHPLVCPAFNADFDGDQMAVHVPLTAEARQEASEIMLSTKNLLKPATGNPVSNPSKDIAWGCYYLTSVVKEPVRVKAFGDADEAVLAYNLKMVGLHEKISVRGLRGQTGLCETTAGRIIFNNVLPEKLPYYNQTMAVKHLAEMTRLHLEYYGTEKTAELLDKIKEIAFYHITLSGYSWSMDELPTLPRKKEMIDDGNRRVLEVEDQYNSGLLTSNERHSKVIEIWTEIKDNIIKQVKEFLPKNDSAFTMVDSGARGSWGQLTQMVGMKGLVSNPAGEIIELPVKASFKEGFSVLEFFISCHGSRKGLTDTALRTANAGYLTRRLVDVSQDVVINADDCGDEEGILITKAESETMGENFISRVIGCVTLEDIKKPKGRKNLVSKGDLITEEIARSLSQIDLEQIRVRSVLRCKARKGLCAACYGYDLGRNRLVQHGMAVGIIAAQSIGEPGTQLTMRTFHTGGVAGLDITQGLPRVEELFEARAPKRKAFLSDIAGTVSIDTGERIVEENGKRLLVGQAGQKVIKITPLGAINDPALAGDLAGGENPDEGQTTALTPLLNAKEKKAKKAYDKKHSAIREYVIPPGFALWVNDGDKIEAGTQLTEGCLDLHELYALRGKEAVENYLLREVQSIYSSQGQKLNDKHISLIARQMFSRILIKNVGDTDLLPGEVIEKAELEDENDKLNKKGKPATGEPLLLGITKVALSTRSFLSAASFMETARVLINAAVSGKADKLEGLKENVIIGRLIPAGTGFKKT